MVTSRSDLEANACFLFDPRLPDDEKDSDIEWEAKLRVKARDLPRLLREGFYWDQANLDWESGYVQLDLSSDTDIHAGDPWSRSRTFFLSDLGDDPQWTAKLVVYAKKTAVVSNFAIEDINMDTMTWATAWTKADESGDVSQWVYLWDRYDPEENFSAIYYDMPLKGWWPWPRADFDDDDVTLVNEAAE
ncbi:hypothetical protein LX32DRAFT_659662 [Colletotrichum zoysiae]|uniref:Uncharacterized protein n=1 Tax=Colletotrichum zoysiae TaxID=1216348 RepID=A0AAD9M7D9_9PEZI|nr:hypothetical protein LX32DRAFT_659662 [Colletotrichum zoysiae]